MANVKTAEANRSKCKARGGHLNGRLLTPSPKSELTTRHPVSALRLVGWNVSFRENEKSARMAKWKALCRLNGPLCGIGNYPR